VRPAEIPYSEKFDRYRMVVVSTWYWHTRGEALGMVLRSCSREPIGAAAIPISCLQAVCNSINPGLSIKDPLIILGTLQRNSWVISVTVGDIEPGFGLVDRKISPEPTWTQWEPVILPLLRIGLLPDIQTSSNAVVID